MAAAQGLARRLSAAKSMTASRSFLSHAQRNVTTWWRPDWRVEGAAPPRAASDVWVGKRPRASPNSTSSFAARTCPLRGSDVKMWPSWCSASCSRIWTSRAVICSRSAVACSTSRRRRLLAKPSPARESWPPKADRRLPLARSPASPSAKKTLPLPRTLATSRACQVFCVSTDCGSARPSPQPASSAAGGHTVTACPRCPSSCTQTRRLRWRRSTAPRRARLAVDATRAFADQFAAHPKVVVKITDDLDELLAFYDFPAEHWKHLHTTNAIESTFATVRLRQRVTKGPGLPRRPAPRWDSANRSATLAPRQRSRTSRARARQQQRHVHRRPTTRTTRRTGRGLNEGSRGVQGNPDRAGDDPGDLWRLASGGSYWFLHVQRPGVVR